MFLILSDVPILGEKKNKNLSTYFLVQLGLRKPCILESRLDLGPKSVVVNFFEKSIIFVLHLIFLSSLKINKEVGGNMTELDYIPTFSSQTPVNLFEVL